MVKPAGADKIHAAASVSASAAVHAYAESKITVFNDIIKLLCIT